MSGFILTGFGLSAGSAALPGSQLSARTAGKRVMEAVAMANISAGMRDTG